MDYVKSIARTQQDDHPEYTRSRALAAALRYAERGVPVFPTAHAPDKRPRVRGGFKSASRDQGRVRAMWNSAPGASIGLATGERFFVVDVDRPGALGELPYELPATWTVRTPKGGLHLYFKAAAGITNSPGGLPKGIDVRGKGGYVIAAPSPGYEVVDRSPMAEAPGWILEMIRNRPEQPTRASGRSERSRSKTGEPIPEGKRNQTLFFEALDDKDSGLTHAEILEYRAEANTARCSTPLERAEVEKLVKSAMSYPVRSGKRSPETEEAVRKLIAAWWEFHWRGLGGQSDRDVLRVLLELALRYGRINTDGSVDISASVRVLSLAANVRYETVSRGCTPRLEGSEWVEKIPADNPAHSATWRIRVPSRLRNTQSTTPLGDSVLRTRDTLPEEAPTWRHRGLVRKGPGGVEALLEVRGPMSRDEVAEALGWGNAREVKRRYLRVLVEQGLAELRGDGRYALVEEHGDQVEEIKAAPYAVLLRRERWQWDALQKTWEWSPDVYGPSRSEDERAEEEAAKHEEHREDFRAEIALREIETEDEGSFEDSTPATGHMLSANRAGRYLLARGWRRLSRREWAHPDTGEVMAVDLAMKEEAA